jgi:hypothetical protein
VIRPLLISLALIASAGCLCAQGPIFHQSDLWTLSYEDLSDILRKYPNMYPLDYGTMGSPLLIRPWNLNPWELRIERDGIPLNRRYDGLADINLQPAGELDSINYNFLAGDAAGRFELTTRRMPVDSPVTEFQIREGYYGYGTVDFAHGQKFYKSAALEITGRLVWYDGLRQDVSASKLNRVRGRFGMDLSRRWRGELTYAGSNDNTKFVVDSSLYAEREEAILDLFERDSIHTSWNPRLSLYLRQDRENWYGSFRAREKSEGWVFHLHPPMPGQRMWLQQSANIASINFPGFQQQREIALELRAGDSLSMRIADVCAATELRRESRWTNKGETDAVWLPQANLSAWRNIFTDVRLLAGASYATETAPLSFRLGQYRISERPLLFAPEFRDVTLEYAPSPDPAPHVDRYLKALTGVRWQKDRAYLELDGMTVQHIGSKSYAFQDSLSRVFLDYAARDTSDAQAGLALSASVPLFYGLRVDGWWSAQAQLKDLASSVDRRGYTRLYFERAFFKTPLIIRSHVSWEHFGQRVAYSDRGLATLGPDNVIGFRISATIKGVTLIWGTENLFIEKYQIIPGYRMIGKEEYLAFIWRLWL